MNLIGRLFRPGLLSNIGSHGFAQLVQIAMQLLLIPLFAHRWGVADYGVWLILFTVPAYLAAADFGFTQAATNELIAAVARDRHDEAVALYGALRLGIAGVSLAVLLVAGLLVHLDIGGLLEFARDATRGHAELTIMLLVAYGMVALLCRAVMSAFQAIGLYGPSGYIYQLFVLAEGLAVVLLVLADHGPVAIAAAYLAIRLLATVFMVVWLHLRARWLSAIPVIRLRTHMRRLLRPALATVALPVAQAVSLQGLVLVVGAFAGKGWVPMFTSVRTLTRLGVQLTSIVSLASMPNFTVATARNAREDQADLVAVSIAAVLCVLLPGFAAISLFGPAFVRLWTGGIIDPSFDFVIGMAAVMVLAGLWTPLANFIVSINEHGRFSWFYLAASLAALGLAVPLVTALGPTGAAISLILLDGVMLVWLIRQGVALGIVHRHSFRAAPARLLAIARRIAGGQSRGGQIDS